MKIFLATILTIASLTLAAEQPSFAANYSCSRALRTAKVQLGNVKSLTTAPISAAYGRPPRGRSMSVIILVTAEAAMNKLPRQLEIGKNITNKCRTVGMVSFALDQTDWVNTYGLLNGRLRRFTCQEAGAKLRWGEQPCL